MHPGVVAVRNPTKIAYVMAATGQSVSYWDLERSANQGAWLLRSLGLRRGDHIAVMLENHPRFLQICWAAQRCGLYYTAISWRLQLSEIACIVNNCGARVFVSSAACAAVAQGLAGKMPTVEHRYMLDDDLAGFERWESATAGQPEVPIADQSEGAPMLYSSGTTGCPNGIKKPLPEEPYGEGAGGCLLTDLHGATEEAIYLSAAPLYDAAPLVFSMGCLRSGMQAVVMEHFDAEAALRCIQQYGVTHSQWVPTMFVQMLKLPEAVRSRYDLSSLEVAIHAGEPCPMAIKEQMIRWWGPVIHEYYAGAEGNGLVRLDSQEWLAHRGSVGRPRGCRIHICDDDGKPLPPGEPGTIYFAGGGDFEYHLDPESTAAARHPRGWTTLGDIGYLDEEGYLYVTGRKHFMIGAGGVKIHPQEAENILVTHHAVVDVAVIGVPTEKSGEQPKAIVQLSEGFDATPELALELIDYCRARLSHIKCPGSVAFRSELPRHSTGKLYKRLLRDEYCSAPLQKVGR